MHIIIVGIVVLLLFFIFVVPKYKKPSPLKYFAQCCHEVLDDEHTSADLAGVVERVIGVVDLTKTMHPETLKAKLESIYQEAQNISDFQELKPKVDGMFVAADNAIYASSGD